MPAPDTAKAAVPGVARHETIHKVAIITGASQGAGAGLVAGYRRRDWAVVASARTIEPSEDPDLLAVAGDIIEPATAGRIVEAALDASAALTPWSTTRVL